MSSERACNRCEHAWEEDDGYSSYTVTGTTFHCLRNLNPAAPFDLWYGEEERLKYAADCPAFEEGVGFHTSPDDYPEDWPPEIQEYLETRERGV